MAIDVTLSHVQTYIKIIYINRTDQAGQRPTRKVHLERQCQLEKNGKALVGRFHHCGYEYRLVSLMLVILMGRNAVPKPMDVGKN